MSIPATEAVTTTTSPYGLLPTTTSSTSDDKDMFLQLMVAQLRYQDPMNPSDPSEFLSQNAQFTALEKMQQVADQTAAVLASQVAFGAAGLVGKTVKWVDEAGDTQTGLVSGVSFEANGPVLDVGGTEVPIGIVQSVVADSSTTTAP